MIVGAIATICLLPKRADGTGNAKVRKSNMSAAPS